MHVYRTPMRWLYCSARSRKRSYPNILPAGVRQLSSDIQGDEWERFYFHRFRFEAFKGLVIHSANSGSFWEGLVPRFAHYSDAVRHAIIALGSTYHLELQQRTPGTPRLEAFTLQQYNKAIQALRGPIPGTPIVQVEISLICCLAFMCIESLRNNKQGSVLHLENGLQIIGQLPTELLAYVVSSKADSDPNRYDERLTRSEMKQFLAYFQDLEVGTQVFGAPAKPVLSLRMYEITKDDDGPWEEYKTLHQCHTTLIRYGHNVHARIWQTLPYKGDQEFWSRPEQIQEHTRVLDRGRRVIEMTDRFMSSPAAPDRDRDRAGCISGTLDKMHARGVFLMAQYMPENITRRQLQSLDPEWSEVATLVETLYHLIHSPSDPVSEDSGKSSTLHDTTRAITLDNGLLIGIHATLYGSGNRDTRRRVMDVLRRMQNRREGLYDAAVLLRVFEAMGADGHGTYASELLLDEPAGPGLSGVNGLIGLEARLAELHIGWKDTNKQA
ncbi:hypothetical protein KJ359_005095 [Pestalotiopsis sp. 9143b]|nr:hypothetical protein KJ359_005095 [Pestalotiopsis sp. 9143b]